MLSAALQNAECLEDAKESTLDKGEAVQYVPDNSAAPVLLNDCTQQDELMDRLHLDLVFLQETWKEPPQGSSESEAQFISRAGYSIIEYTNSNERRGIQF